MQRFTRAEGGERALTMVVYPLDQGMKTSLPVQQEERARQSSLRRAFAAIMVVPYFVQTLPDGRSKAIFTVPESQLNHLTLHPVLCRGASFQLQPDAASHRLLRETQPNSNSSKSSAASKKNGGGRSSPSSGASAPSQQQQQQQQYGVGFLSTEYFSPEPEATAQQIAVRLASRSEDSAGSADSSAASMSHYFGFL